MTEKRSEIKFLFSPRGVAIIGASGQKGKIGYSIVDNIISSGYQGEVYPINPKGGEISKMIQSAIDIFKSGDNFKDLL